MAFKPPVAGRPKRETPTKAEVRPAASVVQSPGEPFDAASLYPPLLAHSIELCRRYGIPEHHAEDFLQEMWLRSFRRLERVSDHYSRKQLYVYLRRRLLGCFQDMQRGRLRHLVGKPEDDAATLDHIEVVPAGPHPSYY